jgi:hypothetical protein
MSGNKRTLSAEEYSPVANDNNEQTASLVNSPDSKRLRHSSSHSENDEDTQIIEQENGITNGKITTKELKNILFNQFQVIQQVNLKRKKKKKKKTKTKKKKKKTMLMS